MPNSTLSFERAALPALLLLAAVLAACSHKSAAGTEEDGGKPAESAGVEVTLVRVARAEISRTINVTGSIAALPNQDVRVSALVAGRIAELKVAEGDHVRVGELIARLDDRPLRDQLSQAEAAAAQARASLENAKLSRERNDNLFERGIAARKDVEDARTQERVAQGAVQQAEAALSLSRFQLSRAEIRAPVDGTIVKRFVSVGEQVDGTAAQPVVEVARLAEVELLANVPAAFLGRLRVGQTLPLSSDAIPAKDLHGRVVAVSQAVDPASNAGLVRIRIGNSAGLLRLGMFVNALVTIETHTEALVVPAPAVYLDQQGHPHVYRVEGDTSTAVAVTIGIETPQRVELLSGVKAGDSVILTGGYGLGDKAKVRVQSDVKP
jgi:membrane fusion protein (multidrug efflux system)